MTENIQNHTVEEKLLNLFKLQSIDSQIDEIRTLRGELPLQVKDLEDEVAGLQTRIEKVENDNKELKKQIAEKTTIKCVFILPPIFIFYTPMFKKTFFLPSYSTN